MGDIMNLITQRSNGIVDKMNDYVYHILGCGAIGSSAAVQLCRMGAEVFSLYDFDVVEEANIGVSQYNQSDIGKHKVNALQEHLLAINPNVIVHLHNKRFMEYVYTPTGDNRDLAILGFDSMSSRLEAVQELCNKRYPKEYQPQYIIDGRMGAEHYQQYIIDKPTISRYKKHWYSDEEGSPEPCNAKATSYCSNMSGSFIANAVRKLVMNQPYNEKFSFNFPTMMLQMSRIKS
jgi:molybdopterin/thiamine biosynthesis adenylyltransferase|tara:strand:+ start:17818 stop:18516 length:699 start_codon:yes stop_codon:yes gene_type:complete